jgi:nitrite reductase (NADH) large subunit
MYDITVFGAEPHPNYNRILLSPVLAGEMTTGRSCSTISTGTATTASRLHAGKKVDARSIASAGAGVIAEDGTEADVRPPAAGHRLQRPSSCRCPGKDLPGVIAYRDIADTDAMIEAAAHAIRHAVVIGGGLLGLEAANGLRCAAWR